jgi:mRNA-degrading endonuclease toxin of MazEF toxin-antitoxin module
VRVDHVRSVPANRLREQVIEASPDELRDMLAALGALLGADLSLLSRPTP